MMIATVSPWTLPPGMAYRREPARPVHRRPADFAAQFDSSTIFYDCFRLDPGRVMLIGPPLNRFAGVLDSLTISALHSGLLCRYTVEHKFTTAFAGRQTHNLCRVVADVPEGESSLQVRCSAAEVALEIQPYDVELFQGKRVLLTLSKNNDVRWICDWMRFHRDQQGADAVLLYDNGSTDYAVESLQEAMLQVSGFSGVAVVPWPYKYGPQGIGRGTWDSSFCQDGAMEDARWRFLAEAQGVLNCDIDELAFCQQGNLFDKAAAAKHGYVRFPGRWVNAPAKETSVDMPRHVESTYQLRPHWRLQSFRLRDIHRCPPKWAVVPRRCPANAQWTAHQIVGMHARELSVADTYYRHFGQIGTNWKKNRTGIEPSDLPRYQEDENLRRAFAGTRWDE